jgi:uncharacterized repeat protein (TIGR01451 family)
MRVSSASDLLSSNVKVRAACLASVGAALLALAFPTGARAQYTAADVNAAVARGVAYIDATQNPDGSFGASFPAAETSFAVTAYGVAATPPGQPTDINNLPPAQQTNVLEAVTWLLDNQDPGSGAWFSFPTYSTGLALEALSYWESLDARVPGAISAGRTYLISTQNAPPAVTGNPASPDCSGADGSGTEHYCGGWNYEASFGRSDESNTGFALTGLQLTGGVPAATAGINVDWQRHVQELTATNPFASRNDGGGSYVPGCGTGAFCSNANNTGSLLFGYGYDGVGESDPKVQAAILFGQDVIDEYELMKATVRQSIYHVGQERDGTCVIGDPGCTWAINFDGGYHYSLWSLSKGLGSYIPANLSDPANWYAKVVDLLLSEQNADGSWPVDGRDDATAIVATGFAVNALGLVGVPTSDLSVTKTDSPDPVAVGQELTYALTVTNNGPDDATGVMLTDSLPANVTFQSASSGCVHATGTVTCSLGDLANGATATVEIRVTPQSEGTITDTASVEGDQTDLDTTDNTVSEDTTVSPIPVGQADLSVTKTDSPDPVAVGQELTYTLTVTNNGPGDATGVMLTDSLPANVTFQSASSGCVHATGTVTCSLGDLANGATATVEIRVTPQSEGTITDTASVEGDQTDLDTTDNTVSEDTTVQSVTPTPLGCEVEAEGRIKAANGDRATFSIDVESGTPSSGTVRYRDRGPALPFRLKSTGITQIVVSADRTQATVLGNAKINGAGSVDFRVDVTDLHGARDIFRIQLSNGYDSGEQRIRKGDVEIECEDDDDDDNG